MSRNEHNKVKKYREKFGYNIPNSSREALLLYKKNGNTLWDDVISKEITALGRLGMFQFYLPKTKFENKYGWQYSLMHMFFDVKHKDLQHSARIVVSGHVVGYTEHTTY